ncbi:MAG TPA: hypothetical protein DCQ26_04245 [Marinilabiliales bacterium]|jgi:hypothetical protein|nr:hypothetical protein [Salinivirgaceae bacterium]OFX45978.1 MAG: hypothetical protein A2W95_03195 [Bacteroidetes bacterium GWA2_40_14]OFX61106.1 MAG: hypothetical protein A2W84_09680 [Bacteroidetes bacterium GWC2_40_13]OFX72710.1 MAG: hypothetical protein A2W96_18380 [Bacteroidetes bacterium GWD2_40_43]OFX91340.1 MAG: hypothetical protein A2W97_03800 [Bacteroidetes bacterium GWE2_40_63]OFY19410.1 MAG: hypothetical protein A2W88_01680 [Bacteroidetes bacterium GWF2_40_13]OFZ25561.1 MAG: hypot
MESLTRLREIKKEVLQMDFNYKNVHRIMYLLYETKSLFEDKYPIPNKDIANDQTKKVIAHELMKLIKANTEDEIKKAFFEVVENFKLVMAYIS